MNTVWKTKYGLRRVRRDLPTLEEAIVAARGLTDDPQGQAEIAASLMKLPLEKVLPEVIKMRAQRKNVDTVELTAKGGPRRAVIVERRTARRPVNDKRLRLRP
jgi:hypothetical protein